MDASRGDLIGAPADPLGHEPVPPGGVDSAVSGDRAGVGHQSRPAGRSANAVAAAGLVIIAAVAGTGLLAGEALARHWAAPAAVLPLALSVVAGLLLIGYARRPGR